MIISVKKEDFEFAFPGDPCHCPIANAIHRHTGKAVHVSDLIVAITGMGHYALPPRARRFIQAFDNGAASFRGFTFPLVKISHRTLKKKFQT